MREVNKSQWLKDKSLKKLVRDIEPVTYQLPDGSIVVSTGKRWIKINGIKLYYTPDPTLGDDILTENCISCSLQNIEYEPHNVFTVIMLDENNDPYLVAECRENIAVTAMKLSDFYYE